MDRTSFLDDPALPAPPGEHHNFVNPTNMAMASRFTFSLCLAVSVLAVGMRMWTKARLIRKVVLEDCDSYDQLLLKTRADDFRGLLFSAGTVPRLLSPTPKNNRTSFTCGRRYDETGGGGRYCCSPN